MKQELLRALERVADMIVGNFNVSFQNELRFMVRTHRVWKQKRGSRRISCIVMCGTGRSGRIDVRHGNASGWRSYAAGSKAHSWRDRSTVDDV